MGTTQRIRNLIATRSESEPFTPALFAGLGSRASIDQALRRLTRAGRIQRIGHGLYRVWRLRRDGPAPLPSPETVARMVADQTGAVVEIHGAEAAHRLGFEVQAPAHAVFYTTGPSRMIRLGNQHLQLKHVATRKLALAGRPAGRALVTIWYLGRRQVTAATFAHLAATLPREEFQALCEATATMPGWMLAALHQYKASIPQRPAKMALIGRVR